MFSSSGVPPCQLSFLFQISGTEPASHWGQAPCHLFQWSRTVLMGHTLPTDHILSVRGRVTYRDGSPRTSQEEPNRSMPISRGADETHPLSLPCSGEWAGCGQPSGLKSRVPRPLVCQGEALGDTSAVPHHSRRELCREVYPVLTTLIMEITSQAVSRLGLDLSHIFFSNKGSSKSLVEMGKPCYIRRPKGARRSGVEGQPGSAIKKLAARPRGLPVWH